jgi:F-type H+-transporting ATPase subunit b
MEDGMESFTIIAQLINFTVLILLLNKFLYKPILLALEKRRSEEKAKIEETERRLNESEQLKEEYLKKLREFEMENVELKNRASEDIKKFKELEIQKAKDYVEVKKSKFNEYLGAEQKKLIENFNENFGELFVKYSDMVLKNVANSELEKEIVNKFIDKLKLLDVQKIKEINSLNATTVFITSNSELTNEQKESLMRVLADKKIKFFNVKFDVDASLIIGIEIKISSYILSWNIKEFNDDFLNNIDNDR